MSAVDVFWPLRSAVPPAKSRAVESSQHGAKPENLPVADGVGRHGNLAATADCQHDAAFGSNGDSRISVVQGLKQMANLGIIFASFDAEGPLPHRRQAALHVEDFRGFVLATEPNKTRSSQNNGIHHALLATSDARVDVPSQGHEHKVWTPCMQLYRTAQR
jgi:hypothetical protein